MHINLSKSKEEIFNAFNATCRNECRRAEREGILVKEVRDITLFVDFFNAFAESKGRSKIDVAAFKMFLDNLVIFGAYSDDIPLAMHSYICDSGAGIARLLHSASILRNFADNKARNTIARANRYLHYQDILYFKSKNYSTYDFGGLGDGDEELRKISDFKNGFGGVPVEQAHYMSILLAAALYLKGLFNFKRF